MKPTHPVTPDKETRKHVGRVGASAFVIGLSATGAVFFSAGEAPAAPAKTENADRAAAQTVQKELNVKWSEVKKTSGGIAFTSRAYAEALGLDRRAVVQALQTKFRGIRDEQIRVVGNQIFIADPAILPSQIFENLCLNVTLNLCKKS